MLKAEKFRAKAAESAESLKRTAVPSEIRELQRSKKSFNALADNEEWLENNYDKMLHSTDNRGQYDASGLPVAPEPVAETEEKILRCLGAAVIMQWKAIPTRLQRELFDTAGSMGDLLNSVELRGQIARFLHKKKDREGPLDRNPIPPKTEGTPHA